MTAWTPLFTVTGRILADAKAHRVLDFEPKRKLTRSQPVNNTRLAPRRIPPRKAA